MEDKKIYRIEEMPEKEEVLLKRDFEGWRVVYPFKNSDGSWNWKNILTGGKGWKYFWLFFAAALGCGLLFWLGINELISSYKAVAEAPCNYCKDCAIKAVTKLPLNFTLK